jgi:hypothetical protein
MKILITACSWCRRIDIGGGRWRKMPDTLAFAEGVKQVSHGACPVCAAKIRNEFKPMRKESPHEGKPEQVQDVSV